MAKSKAKDTKKNTADVGFEDQLWNAADVLRGNLDAAEYKNVVLGLIFLKYLSDRFDERYLELVAEGYGDEEDRDCYMEQNVFFVPEEARWANISQAAHTPEIGQIIDNAMRAIERENDKLKDVLPKNFARPELDKRRLGDVVDLFTNVQMTDNESEKDLLGRAYEYCCRNSHQWRAKTPASSIRRRASCARWLKSSSLSTVVCTTPAAAAEACSCSPPPSSSTMAATWYRTSLSLARRATLPRGSSQR